MSHVFPLVLMQWLARNPGAVMRSEQRDAETTQVWITPAPRRA